MPQLIQFIDAIARQQKRNTLFVTFPSSDPDTEIDANSPRRTELIAWLDANSIGWHACGVIANPNYMTSFLGHIYLDIPFDETNPTYQRLEQHLEHADGTERIEGVRFCVVTLDYAMQNAAHGKPKFWEGWADNFYSITPAGHQKQNHQKQK